MLKWTLNLGSPTPIFQQIVDRVVSSLLSGDLKDGEMLPSIRDLAVQLKVNPNTVSKAYGLLQSQGWVESERGRGLKVTGRSHQKLNSERDRLLDEKWNEFKKTTNHLGLTHEEILKYVKGKL
jgi:GntR family transcriptional regulator